MDATKSLRQLHLPEYRTWAHMRNRCHNPKNWNYRYYGGRGIKVCHRWLESFAAFLADMGPRPTPDCSIDRIDNDGHYEPGNCRWAVTRQQRRNNRQNRKLTHNGETLCTAEWAERLCISVGALDQRLRLHPTHTALGAVGMKAGGGSQLAAGSRSYRRPKSSTGYKGAYRNGSGFDARIKVAGKTRYLGWFRTPEEAALAYNDAAIAAFGEYARLNVIPPASPVSS